MSLLRDEKERGASHEKKGTDRQKARKSRSPGAACIPQIWRSCGFFNGTCILSPVRHKKEKKGLQRSARKEGREGQRTKITGKGDSDTSTEGGRGFRLVKKSFQEKGRGKRNRTKGERKPVFESERGRRARMRKRKEKEGDQALKKNPVNLQRFRLQ